MRKGVLIAAAAIIGVSWWFLHDSRAVAPAAPSPPESRVALPPAAAGPATVAIAFADARPILDAHRDGLPAELTGKTAAEVESMWPGWVTRHDAAIRDRLAQGDDDSLVNLWLYGTTFTTLPRATEGQLTSLGGHDKAEDFLIRRLDDLVDGLAAPGANERLQFGRLVMQRHGIDLSNESGKDQARVFLVTARERANAEYARYRRAAESAKRRPGDPAAALSTYSTIYRDRGLSSDTRLTADFALDQAIAAMAVKGVFPQGSIRRVAIVGPGLDFTDKAEGYDFYPLQTIQPFALVDSLSRAGLAKPDDLRVTTLDLSPRVNGHLTAARERAARGEPYVLQLPLPKDDAKHQWQPDLVAYWQRFGERVGEEVAPIPPPPVAGDVRVRAVRVRPQVTLSIAPQDLDIIVQRLAPMAEDQRFDLIVATNILVYYDAFDQALALANVASMLRPGGYFVTNYAVSPALPLDPIASIVTPVFFDRQQNGDTLFCYKRR